MRGHLNLDGGTLNLNGGTLTIDGGRVSPRPPYNLSAEFTQLYALQNHRCNVKSQTPIYLIWDVEWARTTVPLFLFANFDRWE